MAVLRTKSLAAGYVLGSTTAGVLPAAGEAPLAAYTWAYTVPPGHRAVVRNVSGTILNATAPGGVYPYYRVGINRYGTTLHIRFFWFMEYTAASGVLAWRYHDSWQTMLVLEAGWQLGLQLTAAATAEFDYAISGAELPVPVTAQERQEPPSQRL